MSSPLTAIPPSRSITLADRPHDADLFLLDPLEEL
jgi:hypothetical protein